MALADAGKKAVANPVVIAVGMSLAVTIIGGWVISMANRNTILSQLLPPQTKGGAGGGSGGGGSGTSPTPPASLPGGTEIFVYGNNNTFDNLTFHA